MLHWIWASVIVALTVLEICLSAITAVGQTAPARTFDQLSPGNQKVARAIFEAQVSPPPSTSRRLTLDEIAAQKQSGQGWGRIFRRMQSEGRVQAKTLGQAVATSNDRHHLISTRGRTPTTTSGRSVTMNGRGPHRFGDDGTRDAFARSHNVPAAPTVQSRAGASTPAGVHGGGRGK